MVSCASEILKGSRLQKDAANFVQFAAGVCRAQTFAFDLGFIVLSEAETPEQKRKNSTAPNGFDSDIKGGFTP